MLLFLEEYYTIAMNTIRCYLLLNSTELKICTQKYDNIVQK